MQINDEDIFAIMVEIRKEIREMTAAMDARFGALDRELQGYRATIRVFKWIGALVLAVITLRLGDIKQLF